MIVDGCAIELAYADSPVTVTNKGHTVQFDDAPGSTMNGAGDRAVIGVTVVEGELAGVELDAITPYLELADAHAGTIDGATVNAAALMPASLSYFAYDGSLTTPPCDEGVRWFVLRDAMDASAAQPEAFSALFESTARPVQPLNGRPIE